ncbi:L-lactate dehydrogenase complex protein LldF [Arboricoccus pini]|uniref:L-lactate dehydrogenase complex protein LldF n=1 Tax=Arboricoccus pini TaxID=1963835 RepID=A0A212PW35_9PROT|nr:LutB/LldF family L-lactate oxidation iron-sulfur protein [Arboricoccus pini]SNB51195.1 L-lactate dehydrogenase complex protein LldF [Arboricoccus pini]
MARTDGPSITGEAFPEAAHRAVANSQLRRNIRKATQTIRAKRRLRVGEVDDWEDLRERGRAIKAHTLANLDTYLVELEANVTAAGGHVHWARDGSELNRIVEGIVKATGHTDVIKAKSMTSDETGLNEHLIKSGITPIETDLADLIVQLGRDRPSHILVPAIHRNRAEIRELFIRKFGRPELSDRPEDLAAAARAYLREKFLTVQVGFSGANFAIAETGSICLFESEGNGRMCTTMPRTLVSIMGIEKVVPRWSDMEVFLQLLPRSSTGERMNPYTSIWSGTTPGDGPEEFHLVLLDNGRSDMLKEEVTRQTLQCIRCSACLNICPVYAHTGGHAYGSIYPGPIGAIVTPQIYGTEKAGSLPFASTLCGACYEVCPVKINIPDVLVHLRGKVMAAKAAEGGWRARLAPERLAMRMALAIFDNPRRFAWLQRAARLGQKPFASEGFMTSLPGPFSAWTAMRDMRAMPKESFREWWQRERRP